MKVVETICKSELIFFKLFACCNLHENNIKRRNKMMQVFCSTLLEYFINIQITHKFAFRFFQKFFFFWYKILYGSKKYQS